MTFAVRLYDNVCCILSAGKNSIWKMIFPTKVSTIIIVAEKYENIDYLQKINVVRNACVL